MAAAAIALAESYQRQGHMGLVRWGAVAMVVLMVPAAVYAAIALGNAAHLTFNPATQPKSVARSLEASRRIVAPSG
jgi:hypothetical protein